MIDYIKIGRIPVNLFSSYLINETFKNIINNGDKKLILYANAHLVNIANADNSWLIDFYNKEADFVLCDGAGIQMAAFITGQQIPEKIPFNTWMWKFTEFLIQHNFSIFLLGGDEEVIGRAKRNLITYEPKLNIVGVNNGFFNKEKDSDENIAVINRINKFKPNILFIGFGMPIQEKWIKENYKNLDVNVIFTCGGGFDFISGKRPVAPKIFRWLYLEWFFRFLLEPKRLWKRYMIGNLKFLYYVMRFSSIK